MVLLAASPAGLVFTATTTCYWRASLLDTPLLQPSSPFRVLHHRQKVRRKLESKLFKLLLRQRAVLVNPFWKLLSRPCPSRSGTVQNDAVEWILQLRRYIDTLATPTRRSWALKRIAQPITIAIIDGGKLWFRGSGT